MELAHHPVTVVQRQPEPGAVDGAYCEVVVDCPVRRIGPLKAPLPGDSAVISIVRNWRGSTPVVIVRVVDPESPTTNDPPVAKSGWALVLPGPVHQHT